MQAHAFGRIVTAGEPPGPKRWVLPVASMTVSWPTPTIRFSKWDRSIDILRNSRTATRRHYRNSLQSMPGTNRSAVSADF